MNRNKTEPSNKMKYRETKIDEVLKVLKGMQMKTKDMQMKY
jgi:hypothetical protein